jgi:ribokinase
VDTSYIRAMEDAPTGSAFITVTPDGQNAIVVSPGANLRLTPEDVDEVADEIRAAGVLVVQMEIAPETVYRAVQVAAAGGTRVVLNLAPPRKPPLPVMRVLDPLVVNESEAAFLLGDSFAGTEAAIGIGAASGLLQLGCRSAVITLGAAGAVVAAGEIVAHFPAPEVQVVDTTAAGDAFVGALAGVLVSGRPVAEATEYAVLAGAAAVSKHGAQDSLPTPGSVEAL